MTRELVCISCPVGCPLEAVEQEDGSLLITGNQCPKGEEWGREEVVSPKRIVTTTVALESEDRPRLPVRTDASLPVEHINGLLEELHDLKLPLPVRRGDVVMRNYRGTGVNVKASMSVGD